MLENEQIKKKIVITGAGGFLGSNLICELEKSSKYEVYAFSSHYNEKCSNESIHFYDKNSFFLEDMKDVLKGVILINCAFPRNTSGEEMASGLKYIQKVFERSVECKANAIINISSQSVYSQKRDTIATEETPVSLDNPYAVGKYATELILESICKSFNVKYSNLRLASLIGPTFNQRIVNRFVKQAMDRKKIYVIKNNQKFGFLDVIDAVKAIHSLIRIQSDDWKSIYNVGNGQEYSIESIANCISEVFHKNKLAFPGISIEEGEGYGNTGVSYKLFGEDTGFEPSIELSDSIERIIHHIQNNEK